MIRQPVIRADSLSDFQAHVKHNNGQTRTCVQVDLSKGFACVLLAENVMRLAVTWFHILNGFVCFDFLRPINNLSVIKRGEYSKWLHVTIVFY